MWLLVMLGTRVQNLSMWRLEIAFSTCRVCILKAKLPLTTVDSFTCSLPHVCADSRGIASPQVCDMFARVLRVYLHHMTVFSC